MPDVVIYQVPGGGEMTVDGMEDKILVQRSYMRTENLNRLCGCQRRDYGCRFLESTSGTEDLVVLPWSKSSILSGNPPAVMTLPNATHILGSSRMTDGGCPSAASCGGLAQASSGIYLAGPFAASHSSRRGEKPSRSFAFLLEAPRRRVAK